MKHVLKYKLTRELTTPGIKEIEVQLPFFSPIVSVEVQRGYLCIWAESEIGTKDLVNAKFIIAETGDSIPNNTKHIGTIHHTGWVWHLYEIIKEKESRNWC